MNGRRGRPLSVVSRALRKWLSPALRAEPFLDGNGARDAPRFWGQIGTRFATASVAKARVVVPNAIVYYWAWTRTPLVRVAILDGPIPKPARRQCARVDWP